MEKKYSPATVRVLNYSRNIIQGRGEWDQFVSLIKIAIQHRDALFEYYNRTIRPTVKTKDSGKVRALLYVAMEEMEEILLKLLEVAGNRDTSSLEPLIMKLEANAERTGGIITALKKAKEETLKVSSIKLLHEIILVGLEVMRNNVEPAMLALRIQPLLGYIRYVETTLDQLTQRYPDEKELIDFFQQQIKRMQQAAGGLYLYLEGGEEGKGSKTDLSNALTLLDQAGLGLWAAFSALNQIFVASQEYSGDPLVEDFYLALKRYARGEIDAKGMKDALKVLAQHQQTAALDVVTLERFTFLKPSEREQYIPVLIDILDRRDLLLAYMKDNLENPQLIQEALDKYRDLSGKFSNNLGDLEGTIRTRPDFREASHFHELLSLIRLAYEEKISDFALEKKALFLDEYGKDLKRQLILQERHHPETMVDSISLRGVVERHGKGLEKIFHYLASGNRQLLPEAYEIIEEATQDLLGIQKEINRKAKEMEQTGDVTLCPSCGHSNPVTEVNCSNCSVPLFGASGGGVLDVTESNGAAVVAGSGTASLSENFKFIKTVLEDVCAGIISWQEAEEMLLPGWDRFQDVQLQLGTNVLPVVEETNDPELNQAYDQFCEVLDYFGQVMQEVFSAIARQNAEGVESNIPGVVEAGLEIARLDQHLQHTVKSFKDQPMEFS